MSDTSIRPGRARREVTREAGLHRLSILSVLAGTLAAYGLFAVLAALAGAIARSADAETEFRTGDWTGSGAVAALISAAVLLLSYFFGGYVAGRMARRSGVLHGVALFVLTLVIGAAVGGVVRAVGDDADLDRNLRSIGVPTTWDQVSGVAVASVILSLAAILVGAVLGGIAGERWHTKLARRAQDPEIGPAADARSRARAEEDRRDERLDHDALVREEAAGPPLEDAGAARSGDRGSAPATSRNGSPIDRFAATSGPNTDEPRYTEAEWRERQAPQAQRRR